MQDTSNIHERALSLQGEAKKSTEVAVRCEGVFKVFGKNAAKLIRQAKGYIDAETAQTVGCVVGVNNATFEVFEGELLVIMGLSGSGKSTLLRCISRLTRATAGKIIVDGQDLLSMTSKQLIELRRNK